MSKVHDLNKAKAENAEVKSWTCKTCDTMVRAEGEYCDACAQYWRDVEDGIFDDQDYGQKWAEALDEF